MSIDKLALVAAKQIRNFGKAITLTRNGNVSYDTDTGTETLDPEDEDIYAVIEEFNGKEFQGNLIQVGDKKLIVAASSVDEPSLGDTVTINGKTFSIVAVKTTYSGTIPAVYEIQARKA